MRIGRRLRRQKIARGDERREGPDILRHGAASRRRRAGRPASAPCGYWRRPPSGSAKNITPKRDVHRVVFRLEGLRRTASASTKHRLASSPARARAPRRASARRCRRPSRDLSGLRLSATRSVVAPQPQPISSTRSPGFDGGETQQARRGSSARLRSMLSCASAQRSPAGPFQ